MEENNLRRHEWLAALLFCFCLFLCISFWTYHPYDLSFFASRPNDPVYNYGGIIGAYLAYFFLFPFGFSVLLIPVFMASLLYSLIKGIHLKHFLKWLMNFQLGLCSMSILLAMLSEKTMSKIETQFQIPSYGGLIGAMFGEELLLPLLGKWGICFLFGLIFLLSLKGLGSFSYVTILKKAFTVISYILRQFHSFLKWAKPILLRAIKWGLDKVKSHEAFQEKAIEETEESGIVEEMETFKEKPEAPRKQKEKKIERKVEAPKKPFPVVPPSPKKVVPFQRPTHLPVKKGDFQFPSVDLLEDPSSEALDLEENLDSNAMHLVETLRQFDIEAEIIGIESGPVITRYEISIASGVKVQKVTALDNDIALAMRAKSVRIIAPIPGKAAIGIEIPNQIRKMVTFKELLSASSLKTKKPAIPLVIGKDISGKPVVFDLASMPHMLIAGATGSGKSVCINTIVMSLLYHMTPDELKIMMVDPKKVEMAVYKNIPHLFVPLITNPNKVAKGLRCLIEEMDKRYQLFKDIGVRNIASYNQKDKSQFRARIQENDETMDPYELVPEKLPYIVVIIDELADLMMVAKSEVESAIVRLAQLSRAVGIHLVLATQRPSVDVVTGLIKANIPGRVAFRVASKVDGRTVLDTVGAEKLLGNGDMLFLNPRNSEIERMQGAYLDDEEILRVVEHLETQGAPMFNKLALEAINRPEGEQLEEEDPLYNEAVEVIREAGQASTSFLQRRFRIGYNRASRLIDELESRGIIGPPTSGKSREIYLESE